MNPLKRPSFLLGMAIMFFVLAGCSAMLPVVGKALFGSSGTVKSVTVPTEVPKPSLAMPPSPMIQNTATPVPLPTLSGTCRDSSGTELKVGQENNVGLICLPGNKLFSKDGKVQDGLPSPTPKK